MVIPPPWVEVSNEWILTPGEVLFWLEQADWISLEAVMLERGELPAGTHVVNARMFQVDGGYRLWVLFE